MLTPTRGWRMAVSLGDAAQLGVVMRAVEGMGDGAHQFAGGVAGKLGVGVEGDDIFHGAEPIGGADNEAEIRHRCRARRR